MKFRGGWRDVPSLVVYDIFRMKFDPLVNLSEMEKNWPMHISADSAKYLAP